MEGDDVPFNFDDDSGTSDTALSPSDVIGLFGDSLEAGGSGDGFHAAFSSMANSTVVAATSTTSMGGASYIPTPPDISPLLQKMQGQNFILTQVPPPGSFNSGVGTSLTKSNSNSSLSSQSSLSGSSSSKVSKGKKQKAKANQSKNKIIKFHEYKGPPAQTKAPSTLPSVSGAVLTTATTMPPKPPLNLTGASLDTPYHVLLQQQQLFLQWQLEAQRLPLLMPATTKMADGALSSSASATPEPIIPLSSPVAVVKLGTPQTPGASTAVRASSSEPTPAPPAPPPPPPIKTPKLEDLKVTELKAECKKRSLPVSGPKPNLLTRLQPYTEQILAERAAAAVAQAKPVVLQKIGSPSPAPSTGSITNMSGAIINIQPLTPQSAISTDDTSITMSSPPMSPGDSNLTASHGSVISNPLSPEMEVASPSHKQFSMNLTELLAAGQASNTVPMQIDTLSNPPSVAPMEVDLGGSQSNLVAVLEHSQLSSASPSTSSVNLSQISSPPQLAEITSPPNLTQVTSPPQLLQQVFTPAQMGVHDMVPSPVFSMVAANNQNVVSPSILLPQVPSPLQTITPSPTRPIQTPSPSLRVFKHPSPVQVVPQSSSSQHLASPTPSPLQMFSQTPPHQTASPLSTDTNTVIIPAQRLSPMNTFSQSPSSSLLLKTDKIAPQAAAPVAQQADLVSSQRKQIEELQRQLQQSQLQLRVAQLQAEVASATANSQPVAAATEQQSQIASNSKLLVAQLSAQQQQLQQLHDQKQLQQLQEKQLLQQQLQEQQQQQQLIAQVQQMLSGATPAQMQALAQQLQASKTTTSSLASTSSFLGSGAATVPIQAKAETKTVLTHLLQSQALNQSLAEQSKLYCMVPGGGGGKQQTKPALRPIQPQTITSGARPSAIIEQVNCLTTK